MANDYFQFKQFIVYQEKCAMKVCTDACLFGAWVTEQMQKSTKKSQDTNPNNTPPATYILDIGTGTGLLSLMLAQKIQAAIHAVEIDSLAAEQALQNMLGSPWPEKFTVFNSSIQDFTSNIKYDLIVSNPPFYQNQLKSDDKSRNTALHSHKLRLDELIEHAKKHLYRNGNFAALLPYYRADEFEDLCRKKGMFVINKVKVKQTEKHDFFRVMFWLSQKEGIARESELAIKINAQYSPAFVALLRDYYLYL